MTFTILGITFHEFDIGVSDLILAILSCYFLVTLVKSGIVPLLLFLGIFLSSLFGALFHFFFPDKVATMDGLIVWSLIAISIGITQLGIGYFLLQEHKAEKYNWVLLLYLCIYFTYFFSGHYSYGGIIAFYAPLIILLGIHGWYQIYYKNQVSYLNLFLGVIISLSASLVQIFHIEIDLLSLTYNTLYHIIQGIGFYYIYRFFLSYEKLYQNPYINR